MFSRQNLKGMPRTDAQLANVERGGYILRDCEGTPELIIIATGSEVELAMNACEDLTAKGKKVRVVSMPSTSVFDAQDAEYRQQVLPLEVTSRLAIEAAMSDFWYKYVGLDGRVIGMTTFGESAPAEELFREFGFTLENVLIVAEDMLEDLD